MKTTPNYTNNIKRRTAETEPLTWLEVDNNFQYPNIWKTGNTYKEGMLVVWNDYIGLPNNSNGEMSFWICTNDHNSTNSNPPGGISSPWDRVYDFNQTATNAINDENGDRITTTYSKTTIFERIPITYKLTFNNIDEYTVNYNDGDKNLGDNLGFQVIALPGVTGHNHFLAYQDLDTFYYNVGLILEEAWGGTAIDTGINVTFMSDGGVDSIIYKDKSTYIGPVGSGNNGVHYRNFEIAIPIVYASYPVKYVRFDVVCNRDEVGSTGITNGQLIFY